MCLPLCALNIFTSIVSFLIFAYFCLFFVFDFVFVLFLSLLFYHLPAQRDILGSHLWKLDMEEDETDGGRDRGK